MDHIRTALAESVSKAIDDADLSLREAAKITGIPFATLQRKTTGKGLTGFTVLELFSISRAVGMPMSQLLPPEMAG